VDVVKEEKRMEHPKATPQTLVEAATMSPTELGRAAKFAGVPSTAVNRIVESVSRLPIIELYLSTVNAINLTLSLTRSNAAKTIQGGIRIFAPRYPKPQSEGYFVIVSYSSTDEIIALKRVSWNDPSRSAKSGRGNRTAGRAGAKLHADTKIQLPPEAQGKKLDVTVLSDAYLGMKWKIKGIDIPEAPQVDYLRKEKDKA